MAQSEGPHAPSYPHTIYGDDDAAHTPTKGYFYNHISLNVRDLKASMDFYTKAFGMRHLFTYQVTETYSFTYMAHESGGRSQSEYQTTAEMVREKNLRPGRLELMFHNHPKAIAALTETSRSHVVKTFSHIRMIVPDLQAALRHFEEQGVKILSRPDHQVGAGHKLFTTLGAGFIDMRSEEGGAIIETLAMMKKGLIFLEDPDGNVIEVMPMDGP